ncbi:MAG TPA: hypothetical protein VII94_02415 [Candidatus Saccharimonadales bacterium]
MYKIAISGKANTGKNTLATLINEECKIISPIDYWKYKSMAFADPIKEIVMIMFPDANKDFLYGPSKGRAEFIPGAFKNGEPLTYRQALFDVGTELGRSYNDKIWLENFDDRYSAILSGYYGPYPSVLVVTDVRFRNEFEHLKAKGFYQIRLYRETGLPTINHVSETNQTSIKDEEFDYVIHNNKSLDELELEVRENIIPQLKP